MFNVEQLIEEKRFMRIGVKTTICLLTLDNGFEVVGSSACLDPSAFDYEIGKREAELDALRQVGQIVAYIYTEKLHLDKQQEEDAK